MPKNSQNDNISNNLTEQKSSLKNAFYRAAHSEININLSPKFTRVAFFAIIGLVFIKMLVLNFSTPLIADDFGYASSTSVIDALQREYAHYMTWGGRSVVHFIARIFLMMPKGVFNFFNSLIYTGLTLLIYLMASPMKKLNVTLYLFICISIWLFISAYGQTVLWVTGSCNYLWGAFIILCFLMPYSFHVSEKNILDRIHNRKYFIIIMFFIGILAGWCNENTSGGSILTVALILLYCKLFRKNIKMWMISGLIGNITGFLFMVLAPGNYVRSQHPAFLDNRHISDILLSRINLYTTVVIQTHFTPLLVIFLSAMAVNILIKKDWKRSYISFMYIAVAIATVYAMVLSPSSNTGRAMFGPTIFMITACAHCLASLSLKSIPKRVISAYKVISASFLLFLMIQFTTSFVNAFVDIRKSKYYSDERHSIIVSQIAQGNFNIEVPIIPPPITSYNAMHGLENLSGDASHWVNASFASMYGLESIVAVYSNVWEYFVY